ncbi:MAG: hypothetical protein PHS60_17540, partial [Zavarzinia sp.]|nr:hypothetical protein [Zavarzinia sp.]
GRATYVGSYDSTPLHGETIFGTKAISGLYWILRDRADRDLPIARRNVPALAGVPVDVAAPDPARLGVPLFSGVSLE